RPHLLGAGHVGDVVVLDPGEVPGQPGDRIGIRVDARLQCRRSQPGHCRDKDAFDTGEAVAEKIGGGTHLPSFLKGRVQSGPGVNVGTMATRVLGSGTPSTSGPGGRVLLPAHTKPWSLSHFSAIAAASFLSFTLAAFIWISSSVVSFALIGLSTSANSLARSALTSGSTFCARIMFFGSFSVTNSPLARAGSAVQISPMVMVPSRIASVV